MAKNLMIQGTMSNVGKSVLVAGLCRVLMQDGYQVAPFKSQNMALNSFITEDGYEIGRAQAMQAEAAGLSPSVYMNPILLKPTGDRKSQVVLMGKSIGDVAAKEYFTHKKKYLPQVLEAYEHLAKEADVVLIEGAGSPAEINLKENDIVNMGLAKAVNAPVLLVGDIDPGGVFAQLLGTQMLLEPEEKALLKGLIINKFRGDVSILEPGIRMLEERAGLPVVGCVPYFHLDLEEEDSLAGRIDTASAVNRQGNGGANLARGMEAQVDIVVIRLPHMSNFTDFQVLDLQEKVNLRYVDQVEELGTPNMIILPGTKNTIQDMKWLRESGLEASLYRQVEAGRVLFGICGGYQMLGETIEDAAGAEGGGKIRGMGLLSMHTVFHADKVQRQTDTCIGQLTGVLNCLSGKHVKGYEIHMGRSLENLPIVQEQASVYGTYLHGIFDEGDLAETLVMALQKEAGLSGARGGTAEPKKKAIDYRAYKESQYDALADILRQHLDMNQIKRIIGL
ncbi:MAG: cobyric acid synthase [Lachnospiraceae bacterium]|nr:cobyric acid synthase [Lachnospiraceae bacterium]